MKETSWQWDGETGGGEAPADVIAGGGEPRGPGRRGLLIGAGVLAAGGASWAFGRSGGGGLLPVPSPTRAQPTGPKPTTLSGPTPLWTYRGPEEMTPERLTAAPGRPVYLSPSGLQVLRPSSGDPARLVVFEPPSARQQPGDRDLPDTVVVGPDHLFATTYPGHLEARHLTDPAADWSLPLPEELEGRVRLAGYDRGVLYGYSWGHPRPGTGSLLSHLFAVQVADRSVLWVLPTDREEQPIVPTTGFRNPVLVCVRFREGHYEVVARDAANGNELWTAPGSEDLRWCVTGAERIYLPDGTGGVRMLRPTGEPGWTYSPAKGESWRALPPVENGPRLLIPRDQGTVTGNDTWSGAEVWSCRLPYPLDRRSRPVVADDTLFVPGPGASGVSAIHTTAGELGWTFKDSGPGKGVWTVAADKDRLYAGHDDVLHALPLR
ncbi:PQQ-binding-like beta-propeller repeat protein [Kitasatospora brasiliensis]|uniref:outer membrane protein assembly factor BamB family protein n=1 Tax=Kitasatospora brasiliensis TaxID=3058040 RepID=UPI00292DF236|nr:PQQ-binding-like beta-propeller repeat protein [Kitasatospora sp. K002]